ncbi:hypothetical protein PATA110616_07055 [Paenibacillus tarimensis]
MPMMTKAAAAPIQISAFRLTVSCGLAFITGGLRLALMRFNLSLVCDMLIVIVFPGTRNKSGRQKVNGTSFLLEWKKLNCFLEPN